MAKSFVAPEPVRHMFAATHVRTISARRIVSILIVTVRIRLRCSSKKQAAEKDEYADLLVHVVLRFGYLRVQNRSALMNRGLIQVFVFVHFLNPE